MTARIMAGMSNSKKAKPYQSSLPPFCRNGIRGFFYFAQTASAIDKRIGKGYDLYEKYNLYE
ncbi:hypothetical protein CE91St36_16980 [Christensenellaceae bacterium]|nr:hypothetical protein CE91St36_16980 [Christensenellaceae bacterium]BDF61549.1 hypothetical protein CE91St37_16990 [Christensenellaceae bacterium]